MDQLVCLGPAFNEHMCLLLGFIHAKKVPDSKIPLPKFGFTLLDSSVFTIHVMACTKCGVFLQEASVSCIDCDLGN